MIIALSSFELKIIYIRVYISHFRCKWEQWLMNYNDRLKIVITPRTNRRALPSTSIYKMLSHYHDIWNFVPDHVTKSNQIESNVKKRERDKCFVGCSYPTDYIIFFVTRCVILSIHMNNSVGTVHRIAIFSSLFSVVLLLSIDVWRCVAIFFFIPLFALLLFLPFALCHSSFLLHKVLLYSFTYAACNMNMLVSYRATRVVPHKYKANRQSS